MRHSNILELLASYTYNGKHNLIFSLAQDGTLADLFAKDRQKTSFDSNITFLIALAKLSSAIEHVHDFIERRIDLNLIGCHHDLRPANIFISEDTLLLADFGLTRFKASSESSGTGFKQGIGDYLAPECEEIDDSRFSKFVVRRSSDIWSFGCILAEAATYMMLGPDAVSRFRAKRTFTKDLSSNGQWQYSLFHCGPGQPNKAVSDWLLELRQGASTSCRMLLNLIEHMICVDEKMRPRAKEVTAKLQLLAQFELVETVDALFDKVLSSSNSLDAIIEQKRFEAWKYAMGFLDPGALTDIPSNSERERSSVFNSILNCLLRIRMHLQSFLQQTQNLEIDVFHQLGRFNDRLINILDGRQQEQSRTYFRMSLVESADVELFEKTQDDDRVQSVDKEISMRIALKHMTKLATEHVKIDTCKRQLDSKTIKIEYSFGEHSICGFQDGDQTQQVLVEWRYYECVSADKLVNHELFIRAEAIADLLSQEKPEEFRALDCRGFFHEPARLAFGIVYRFPKWTELEKEKMKPVSLRDLIAQTTRLLKRQPHLEDKYKLAHTLARSVLEFHLIGWLHKRLMSSNIAFFATTKRLEDPWFQKPYIVGFNHSRPDEPSAFTRGHDDLSVERYHHPAYCQPFQRFCAEFDYYSLGIVLLEIGLWQTLDQITDSYTGSPEEIRDKLLTSRITLLKQTMGRTYYEAVRVCVQGDFALSQLKPVGKTDGELNISFEKQVVSQLNKFSN